MPVRVAINGFGRVGRCVLRSAYEQDANIEIVAINDLVEPRRSPTCSSTTRCSGASPDKSRSTTAGSRSRRPTSSAFAETDPRALPWEELGVDVVIESTGRFRTRAGADSTWLPAPAR